MKKVISLLLAFFTVLTMLSGCQSKNGKVYFLNFKPEQDAAWQRLAKAYTEETGVEVEVVTAAQGTYEQTLTAEIDKDAAPTLFQVNGSIGLETWKDYCLDLTDTEVYKQLVSDDFALKSGGRVYAVAYVYEAYGLITNKSLLKKAGYDIEDITSFEKLNSVAEDITARKDELGFAAFTSSGLGSSSAWRFSGHLANLPLYYEFEEGGITGQPQTVEGKYLANFKKVWDMYIKNSTIKTDNITSEQNDAVSEFKAGKAVFYQNGTWEYDAIKAIGDENIGFLPIYFGVDDEMQGLCCGTENYWCVNSEASDEDIKATLDFVEWVASSDKGTAMLADDMGFVSPFKNAKDVKNTLSNIMTEYVNGGKYSVTWAFSVTPNVDAWRNRFSDALAAYSTARGSWNDVEKAFIDGWRDEYINSHQ